MAVNLATKYAKQFAAAFAPTSYFKGKVSEAYKFDGVKKIVIQSPLTTPLTDYVRTGVDRYGTPTEMDTVVQEMELTQDKAFTKILDRGNYSDSMMAVSAGNWMSEQIKQIATPETEKYAIRQWLRDGGSVTVDAKPTKSTVVESFAKAVEKLDDAFAPGEDRYLYVTAEMYKNLSLSSEFLGLERLGEQALSKGIVGEFEGAKIVKVPTSYMPENCYGFLACKDSILLPRKISTFKTHTNPPGIDGWLMEGRLWFDAFVLGAKANGVCAIVLDSKKQATPTITQADNGITIASANAAKILYTLDGTDPRFNPKAEVYSAAISTANLAAGKHLVKAVAYGGTATPFTSDIAEKEITVA